MDGSNNVIGVFGLSSAICCHLLSKNYMGVKEDWFANKWFWAGFFGNLPVVVSLVAHLFLSRDKEAGEAGGAA